MQWALLELENPRGPTKKTLGAGRPWCLAAAAAHVYSAPLRLLVLRRDTNASGAV